MKQLFKKIFGFFSAHKKALQAIFILSILVFVTFEFGRISRTFNGQQVKDSLATQSPGSLLLMLVLGMISVLPMMNYDYVITELLPGDYSKGYIFRSGWIVNTFTNFAGFGGFLGASLRANFYGKHASQKQVLYAVSKIALFLLAGLSVWCFVALVMLFGFQIGQVYQHYWIWLVGGAAYFPLLMIITHWKDSAFFSDLPIGRELRLTLGSVLEWGACGGLFLIIGNMINVHVNFGAVFILFMIANVIGVISMIPGGLGSFDVFMILGLSYLGVNSSVAVVWLLFYRLFYYIFPFLIGAFLFIQNVGSQFNQYLNGLPRELLQKVVHGILVIFLYGTAIYLLILGMLPNLVTNNILLKSFIPYTFYFLDSSMDILVAFILFGCARGIANKVKRAYWPTLLILAIAIINSLRYEFSIKLVVYLGFVILITLLSKNELYRKRLEISWEERIIDGAFFAGSFIIYALIWFYNAPGIVHRHPVPNAWLFPGFKVWLNGLVVMLVAALILVLIYRYLHGGRATLSEPFDEKRVRAVIEEYGGNEISHLAFLKDKSIYYYQVDGKDEVILLYRKKANKLIIMGEPIGNNDEFMPAIQQMMTEADLFDCELVFYEITETLTMHLHELGFDFMKFGEEGFVDLPDFNIKGNKHKGERSLMNKFEREGYTFDVIDAPLSDETYQQLKAISDDWLNGRSEKGFSLGFFDRYYLNQAPVAVVYDKDHKIIAFANLMPTGDKKVTSIDLMRHYRDAPSGIMDMLFINLFYYDRDQGYQYFNMGMAPLANVGTSQYSFTDEKIGHLIYEYADNFYEFQGLWSYKNKYVSKWIPKYVAYRKGNLLMITMIQLLMVDNQKINPETKDEQNEPMLHRFRRAAKFGKSSEK